MDTYADRIRTEQDAIIAGTATACGYIAGPDQNNMACIRAAHDPGAGHVADTPDGLVQWLADGDVG